VLVLVLYIDLIPRSRVVYPCDEGGWGGEKAEEG